jgi:SAM-dependent methyltransferase
VSFRRRLLELACGQAGDLSRWTDAGYSVVVGIDKNNNNITDPMNGAYARAMRMSGDVNVPNMAFMVGDCGKLLSNGDAFVDADDSKSVWQSLARGHPPDYLAPVASAFRSGRASSASASASSTPHFDAVSCQFAIHYFFESPETLDAFLKNVAKHLVEGGYFMCSFMDGAQVDTKLRATNGGVLTGRVANTVIWAIHKNYDTLDVPSDDIYGKTIGVYLENTRQLIKEYIVPFEALVEKAEAAGLSLKESETFASTFERESRNHQKGDPMYGIFDKFKREGVQRGFSNLNRWAVFRKR